MPVKTRWFSAVSLVVTLSASLFAQSNSLLPAKSEKKKAVPASSTQIHGVPSVLSFERLQRHSWRFQLSLFPDLRRATPHNIRRSVRFRRWILYRRGFGFIRGSVRRLLRRSIRILALVVVRHRVWHSPKGLLPSGCLSKAVPRKCGKKAGGVFVSY